MPAPHAGDDAGPRPFGRTVTIRFTHGLDHDGHAIDALGQAMAVVARNAWAVGDRRTARTLSEAADTVIIHGMDGLAAGWAALQLGLALDAPDPAPGDDAERSARVLAGWLERRAEAGALGARWGETTAVIARAPDGRRTFALSLRALRAHPAREGGPTGAEVSVSDTMPPEPGVAGACRRAFRLDTDRLAHGHDLRLRHLALRMSGLARRMPDDGGDRVLAGIAGAAARGGLHEALVGWSAVHLAIAADLHRDGRDALVESEDVLLEIAARHAARAASEPARIAHRLAVVTVGDHGDDRRAIAVETLPPAPPPVDAASVPHLP